MSKAVQKDISTKSSSGDSWATFSKEKLLELHDLMVRSRVLEDRLIKIYRSGEAFFWIGSPGEEAFGVPLGLLTKNGRGPSYDYLHLHYRGTPTLIAMGMPFIDSIRLMMNRVTDPSTGGRNFCNHYCYPDWNVVPVSSPIEVQYIQALGTAHVQAQYKKEGKDWGITVVTGGDAGTAEGDFASCLVWASRKGHELPMLITVTNNWWGISTSYEGQHGESAIADRAKAFGIRSRVINGNDPIESYLALQEEIEYIRKTGKPSFVEARVSRLNGHSSASGANKVESEVDATKDFEKKLIEKGLITPAQVETKWKSYEDECFQIQTQVRGEAPPSPDSIWEHTFVAGSEPDWRKF